MSISGRRGVVRALPPDPTPEEWGASGGGLAAGGDGGGRCRGESTMVRISIPWIDEHAADPPTWTLRLLRTGVIGMRHLVLAWKTVRPREQPGIELACIVERPVLHGTWSDARMIRVSTAHYLVSCRGCPAQEREEAVSTDPMASRRFAAKAFVRRGWREREGAHVPLSQKGLGAGAWECPTCAGSTRPREPVRDGESLGRGHGSDR
jgi:hypothetical protein